MLPPDPAPPIPETFDVPGGPLMEWQRVFWYAHGWPTDHPRANPNGPVPSIEWTFDAVEALFRGAPGALPPTLSSNRTAAVFVETEDGRPFVHLARTVYGVAVRWLPRLSPWPAPLRDALGAEMRAPADARTAFDTGGGLGLDAFTARAAEHLAEADAVRDALDALHVRLCFVRTLFQGTGGAFADATFRPLIADAQRDFTTACDALFDARRIADEHARVYRARFDAADVIRRETGGVSHMAPASPPVPEPTAPRSSGALPVNARHYFRAVLALKGTPDTDFKDAGAYGARLVTLATRAGAVKDDGERLGRRAALQWMTYNGFLKEPDGTECTAGAWPLWRAGLEEHAARLDAAGALDLPTDT